MRRINHSSRFIEQFAKYGSSRKLGDVVELMDDKRRPINDAERQSMKTGKLYPYYGATGQVDMINSYLTDDTLLCIAEDCGNYKEGEESSYIITGKAWVNNHAHLVKPNDSCNITFLHYYLTICDLTPYVTGTTRQKLTQKSLVCIPVILPPINEQQSFVSIVQQADKSKFSDFKSRFIEMFGNPLSVEQKYPLKRLGDCVDINPRRPQLSLSDTDQVSFVPMPCVSEDGYLQDVDNVGYGTVKKGFTYFEEGDVLFAKITPCMENGKGAIAEGLTNNIGMGSTEFHVLRPIEGVSSPYWLLALTRLPFFRERASKNMTGTGGQKRVPAKYLENFMVGLPPIEEQNRFENIYKQADKSGFELRKSIKTIDIVIKSLINKK